MNIFSSRFLTETSRAFVKKAAARQENAHCGFLIPSPKEDGARHFKFRSALTDGILIGLLVFSMGRVFVTAQSAFSSGPTGSYDAALNESITDGTTWAYDITEVDGPAHGVSHISVQIACLIDGELDPNYDGFFDDGVLVSTDPSGAAVEDGDPSTATLGDVIKWDATFSDFFVTPFTVSFTLDEAYPEVADGATIIIKYGHENPLKIEVPGPGCSSTESIVVDKVTVPFGDSTSFTFATTGNGYEGFSLTDADDPNEQELVVETYAVSETVPEGWVQTSATCDDGSDPSSIDLDEDETVICTFTNSKLPTLTLEKTVINNNGGNAVANDFQAYIDEGAVAWSVAQTLEQGTYTASESNVAGYADSAWGGDCAGDGSITLDYGDEKTCTITNDDIAPSLTLLKQVINDNGGIAEASDWTLTAFGPTAFSGPGPSVSSDASFEASSYALSESVGPSGYTAGSWSCIGDGDLEISTVTLGLDESTTCTITNDDIAPQLTVIKQVVGGNAVPSNFTMLVTGTNASPASFPGSSAGVTITLNAGSYSVDEDPFAGYDKTLGEDCSGTIFVGEEKTCIITNTDNTPPPPSVFMISGLKFSDENNNGEYDSEDGLGGWTITITDDEDQTIEVTTNQSGLYSSSGYTAGTYTVCEVLEAGWTQTYPGGSGCHVISVINQNMIGVNFGNFFNPPPPPPPPVITLTVTKVVTNDDTGDFEVSDFPLFIDETAVSSGESNSVEPGTHIVSETNQSGYIATFSGDCDSEGSVTLEEGDEKTCTITNDDEPQNVPPPPPPPGPSTFSISGIKFFDEDEDGAKDENEGPLGGWTIKIPAPTPLATVTGGSGAYTFSGLSNGSYTVCEGQQSGWTQSYPGGSGCHFVVIDNADIAGLNFGNHETPSTPIPTSTAGGGGGGGGGSSPVLLIEKSVADDFTNPGATIQYSIQVQNIGYTAALSTVLTDTLPEGFTYTETGLKMRGWDLGTMEQNESETVTYQVSVSPSVNPGNYVNTAQVTATNYHPVSDDATIEVRVPSPVLGVEAGPMLTIGKIADMEFVNPGSSLTYTVTIVNTGEAAAINLVIRDTLPEGFTAAEGSISSFRWDVPALLTGESWQESFRANVGTNVAAGSYENVVTAVADNYTGELRASYTVAVREGEVLGLPSTGASAGAVLLWLVALFVCIFAGAGLARTISRPAAVEIVSPSSKHA